MKSRQNIIVPAAPLLWAGPANAHVSEQALSLLLPTEIYIAAGLAAVLLSVLISSALSRRGIDRLFATLPLPVFRVPGLAVAAGVAGFATFAFAFWSGFYGTTDPLRNFMPLFVWTVLWVLLPVLQMAFGDLWAVVNPWSGLYRLLGGRARGFSGRDLPAKTGALVALAGFVAIYLFVLADPAPDQARRLAQFAGAWWGFHFAMMWVFGPVWLRRAEALTVFYSLLAQLSPLGWREGLRIGLPGWKLDRMANPAPGLALFAIVMLGAGSFDGLNETFWWLARIGVNPLEFPGRSALILPTILGFVLAEAVLLTVFSFAVWSGWKLAGNGPGFGTFWRLMALSLLPIAAGYHIAHYLTTFLVNGQYLLVSLSDPLARGDDWFGLGSFYVTTGFFNQTGSVRTIFLIQAGAVVSGHILAILLSHASALKLYKYRGKALLSQGPMIVFMLVYTLLGLWLLASPRGL